MRHSHGQRSAIEWRILDPRLLRTFVAIADSGSFTHASARLHSTQSTVIQQLSRLEDAVAQPLIDRAARPVMPAAAGERLLAYARRLLALQDLPVTELRRVVTGAVPGRRSHGEITVFDLVGFAIEDFAALRLLRDLAERTGHDRTIDLLAEPEDPRDLLRLVGTASREVSAALAA